jgi:hypothetical protein
MALQMMQMRHREKQLTSKAVSDAACVETVAFVLRYKILDKLLPEICLSMPRGHGAN